MRHFGPIDIATRCARVCAGCFVALLTIGLPTSARPQQTVAKVQSDGVGGVNTGQTAGSPVGQVGRRKTRDDASPTAVPMERIDNRIANRVQSRIRNRIDRYYNPKAGSPFSIAADDARKVKKH